MKRNLRINPKTEVADSSKNIDQTVTPTESEVEGRRHLHPVLLLLLKTTGITAIAYLLSLLFTSPFAASLTALFSSSEKSDFTMSDLFFQIADQRPVRIYEDRLAIVDIGHSNREEIAEILSLISLCGPRSVAIDINFEQPGLKDSLLLESLSSLPSLVLPLGVRQEGKSFSITDRPFFYDDFGGVNYGVVNFPTSASGSSIREYAKYFPMKDGGYLPSFPQAAALAAGYDVVDMEKGRTDGVKTDIISYHSREIPIIRYDELIDRANELTDKIVLVGATTEAGDVFSTPLRRGVSGLEIHAYSLSTILDGAKLEKIPGYEGTVIAVIVCFLIVLGSIGIRSGMKGLFLRLVQIGVLYFFVRIGYSLFVDKDIIVDFSQAILMIAFGLFSVDLWNGTACLLKWIIIKIRKLHSMKAGDSTGKILTN